MSTLLLKAAAANIKSDNSDLTIGRTHSQTKMAPLLVKSKPGIFYRLVDEKTGQIVKTQTLVRKGKNLQVLVDQKLVLELEDFFAHPTDPQTSLASLPGYLVDTSTSAETEWGLISPASASTTAVNGQDLVWTTGMPVAHTLEPQAIGLPAVAALSTGSVGMGGLAGLTALAGGAAAAGGGGGGGGGGGDAAGGAPALPKIGGTLFAGQVKSNGNGDLTVDAYDSSGNKLGTAVVNADGTFEITLNRAYSGIVVLKTYDKDTSNADKPTHLDEATNADKPLTDMLAVLNFSGTTITGVKVTPLTHAASLKAGVTLKPDGTPDTSNTSSSKINDANAVIAKAFGISTLDLITANVDLTENTPGASANDYGVLLNLFSQMENNGVSMTLITNGIDDDGLLSADLKKALNQAGAAALQTADNNSELLPAIKNKIKALTNNDLPTGFVKVIGAFKEGVELIADTANIQDNNGLPNTFSFQWQTYDTDAGQWSDIPDTAKANLTLTADLVSKKVRVQVSYTDNQGNKECMTAVANQNDAPVNTVPAPITNIEANNKYLADGTTLSGPVSFVLNGLGVADIDAGDGNITVKLSVNNGILNAQTSQDQNFTVLDNGTASITLTGKATDLNNWLQTTNALSYTPNTGFTGSDTLTMLTDDGGNTGDGGAKTHQVSADFTVVDTRAPTLLSSSTSADGKQIVLVFDELLDTQNLPPTSAFTVTVTSNNPANNTTTFAVSGIAADGKTMVLDLGDHKVEPQHSVSLSYTTNTQDPTKPIQDTSGNDAQSFSQRNVTVTVPDEQPPSFVFSDPSDNQFTFTYAENRTTGYEFGQAKAIDNVAVTRFEFSDSGTQTSSDGCLTISNTGVITITAVGIAHAKLNNFESTDNPRQFDYSVTAFDASGKQTSTVVTLKLTDVNEAPVVANNSFSFAGSEDEWLEITYAQLVAASSATDGDAGDSLSFKVTNVGQGQLQIKDTNDRWNTVSTQPDSTNNTISSSDTIRWKHPTSDFHGNISSAFSVVAVDSAGLQSTGITVGVNVAAVNDAPVASGSATLTAVAEDTTNPAGALVSALFSSRFSDVDGNSLAGVAITANAATATQGTWQWKADGGDTWNDIATTALADATALYLAANTLLRFVPVANYSGTPGALTARLVDSSATGLTNGNSTNVSANGGSTAFSSGTVSLNTNITAVNDAPVRTAGTTTPIVVNEDSANSTAVSLGLSSLNYGPGGGGDESSQTLTYKITNIPSSITLWKADGSTQVNNNTTLTLAELQGLMYKTVANANNSTLANLSWTVTDNGTSPQTITETLGITITAVNDAPVASGSATLTAVAEDTTSPAGALVSALFNSRFSNVDGNTLAGVAITANAATATQGKWQWQANGTTTWTDVPTTGLTNTTALYLAANTSLRFVPVANFNGTPGALTARLVDSSATGLTNGNSSTNVSTNGGTSAYSSATVTLGTSITPVNDQPVISGPPDQTGNSGLPFALPTFYTLSDKDAVNSPMQLSIKVTEGNSANGLDLSYQLRTGVTFLDVSTDKTYRFQGSLSDLQNWVKQANFASVTFSAAFSGQANVSLTLSDNGNDGGPVKSSSHTFNVAVSNTPVLADAYTSPDNTKIVLYFNEALNSTTAPDSAFAISIAGVSVTATAVSVSGNSVVLTLPRQVVAGDAISVSYTAPSANNATSNAAIQDSLGNDATSFSTNVTNLRGDTSVPLLQSAELSEDAQRVILTFHEALAPTTAAPNMFTLSRPGGTSSALSSVKVVNKNSVVLALSVPVTPSDVLTVGYSAPSVNNTLNTNSAVQDMYGVDARSFNAYTVFSVPNMPVNQVNQKVFAAPVGSQIDITGLGVSDTYSTTTETPLQIALKVTSGNVQLLASALTANGVNATGGSVSGGFRSGSSLTLTGTEAKLNTFLSTLGNVKYTAPSAFPASGAVLTMVSTVSGTAKYQDTDTVVFAPPNTTGLGLSIGSMPIRQGMNGSAIGIKSNSNLLTMALFDVVDTSLPAGTPSPTQLADYNINIVHVSGMGIKLQNSFFYKTAAPTTAVTSFTLAEVYNGNVGFYYSGATTLPTFTATVSKASITSAVASSNLQFLSGASSPELTGGVVYYGDGSGVGGTGGYSSGNGTNGVGDGDNITGTETHDVIFGDGSGGGEGSNAGSGGFQGVAGRGGGGNDNLNGGSGNDIMFGDGFAGTDIRYTGSVGGASGSQGGYGGGGAAGSVSKLGPLAASIGGGSGGFGQSYLQTSGPAPSDNSTYAGQANTLGVASNTSAWAGPNGFYIAAAGAGVTATGNSGSPTGAVVTAALTKATYDKVLSDISKTNSTDLRVFDQVMGAGNDVIDAGAGWDWVMGGYGNDTLIGGKGDDVMWGRGGGAHLVNLNIFQGKTTATETTEVNFTDGLRVGESATVGGLTITANSDMNASNVANAFASLAHGANSNSLPTSTTFTYSGSLSGWSSGTVSQATTGSNWLVTFTSTTTNTDVADLAASYKLRDNDIFKWVSGDAGTTGATDIIKDFTAWSNNSGDKLDILGLLTGYNSTSSTLSQWVSVAINQIAPSTNTANSTKITIDIDGSGSGTVNQIIWLEGVTLSTDVAVLKTNGVLIA